VNISVLARAYELIHGFDSKVNRGEIVAAALGVDYEEMMLEIAMLEKSGIPKKPRAAKREEIRRRIISHLRGFGGKTQGELQNVSGLRDYEALRKHLKSMCDTGDICRRREQRMLRSTTAKPYVYYVGGDNDNTILSK
jgi:hypothetical protein